MRLVRQPEDEIDDLGFNFLRSVLPSVICASDVQTSRDHTNDEAKPNSAVGDGSILQLQSMLVPTDPREINVPRIAVRF